MNKSTKASTLAAALLAFTGATCVVPLASWSATTAPATQEALENDAPLPRDPANIEGTFDNGLHYLVRKNANPPGKVYLYLAVKSGAMNENPNQNGLAHFLEHMAFKGSEHFAPMKLIPLLTHMGMQFGADTNAHTNQFETVFKLTMQDTKPATIDVALTIFSDYASALSLFPIQIESERRVILEEMRLRKGVGTRLQKQANNILFPGSPYALHDVLGDPEIIKHAPPELFSEYWNQWYRPENITLVVVGDIDPQTIIDQAKPKLGTFKARTPAKPPVLPGIKSWTAPRAVVLSDPEQVGVSVELMGIKPAKPLIKTTAQYRQELVRGIGEWIVNRRFSDLINSGKAPFRRAGVGSGDILHDAFEIDANAEGESQDWQAILDGVISGIKQAADRGFTKFELDLAKDAILSGAARSVKTESTQDSSTFVVGLSSAVDLDRPIMSAAQDYGLVKQILNGLTLEEVRTAFVDNFKMENYAYVLKMPSPKDGQKLPSDADVLTAASSAWNKPTSELAQNSESITLLPAEPVPGKVVSTQTDNDLKLTTVTFENGVVMHYRFSDYKKDEVIAQIILPGGSIEETEANHGISTAAGLMLRSPATSRISRQQIRDLMTGKNVAVRGAIGLDSMSISVQGSPADLPLGFELVNAELTDAKLEPAALAEWKKGETQRLRRKPSMAQAQLADAMEETVRGNDPRLAPLTQEVVDRQQPEKIEAWYKHIAEHSAIELSIVGDISKDQAIALVGKYIGSLPFRTGTFHDLDSLRQIKRGPGPFIKTVDYQSIEPKAMVMVGYVSCDELDPARRPLSLASLILTERLIRVCRFEKQLVYSINCSNAPGTAIPGLGVMSAGTTTDPKNVGVLSDNINTIFKDFAEKGPTEDELASAKKQIANQYATVMKEPNFWVGQTAMLDYHKRSLDDLKQLPDIFQTFTVKQVQDAVKKYVVDGGMIKLEVVPGEPAKAG